MRLCDRTRIISSKLSFKTQWVQLWPYYNVSWGKWDWGGHLEGP